MRTANGLFLVVLTAAFGCGGQTPNAKPASQEVGRAEPQVLRDGAKAPAIAGKEEGSAVERKIVHTATLELVVKDIDALRPAVEKLMEEIKGYVAKSDVAGEAGRFRKATWSLKVPVSEYRKAVETLLALGQAVRNLSDSQDVTEEFVDLAARVKNFKAEEVMLNKLLTEQAVRIEDLLKIREQVKLVRGEVERAEGRMKYLSTTAATATIQLTAREEQTYVPEKPEAAPTFGERISGTFSGSLDSVLDFGKAVAVFFVGAAPWLVILAPPLLLIVWATRRLNRRVTASMPTRSPYRDPPRRRLDPSTASSSAPPPSSPVQP